MSDIDDITSGTQLLGPTGRIWTVQGTTPSGTRVVLTRAEPDGEHCAVVDIVAARRMVRIDQAAPAGAADTEVVERDLPVLAGA